MFAWIRHWIVPQHSNKHRAQLVRSESIAVLGVLCTLSFLLLLLQLHLPFLPTVLGDTSVLDTQGIFAQVNSVREKEGKATLSWNDQLAAAAEAKANDMIAQGYWAHVNPAGKQPWAFIDEAGYRYSIAGENLARNYSSAEAVIAAWMASPTHRANIVQGAYTETGIAAKKAKIHGKDSVIIVQMFGSRKATATFPGDLPTQGSSTARILPELSLQPLEATNFPTQTTVLGTMKLVNTLSLYRTGVMAVLLVILAVLWTDWIGSHEHRRKHPARSKHLAHIALLAAVLFTVLVAEGGRLL